MIRPLDWIYAGTGKLVLFVLAGVRSARPVLRRLAIGR